MATDPAPPKASPQADPALSSVTFENYRCFKKYRMDGLRRVNLLVGKNNAGKSVILEGLQLISVEGSYKTLLEISIRRGEATQALQGSGYLVDVRNFGYRRPQIPFAVSLASSAARKRILEFGLREVGPEGAPPSRGGFDHSARNVLFAAYDGKKADDLPVTEDGLVDLGKPVIAGASGLFVNQLRGGGWFAEQHWDEIRIARRTKDVGAALRILEPNLSEIDLVGAATRVPDGLGRPSFRAALGNSPLETPLGSLGDGMGCMLSLAVGICRAAKGTLFIDEIDTGLHYSAMADMWKLVIATARKLNVQVFATTHSWDCIEGLAEACRRDESFLGEVALHSIHRHLPESIPHDGESILSMPKFGLDPR